MVIIAYIPKWISTLITVLKISIKNSVVKKDREINKIG